MQEMEIVHVLVADSVVAWLTVVGIKTHYCSGKLVTRNADCLEGPLRLQLGDVGGFDTLVSQRHELEGNVC